MVFISIENNFLKNINYEQISNVFKIKNIWRLFFFRDMKKNVQKKFFFFFFVK